MEQNLRRKYSDDARSIAQTSDGGYALAGYTNSSGAGGDDCCWSKLIMPATNNGARPTEEQTQTSISVMQTSDRGYVLAAQQTLMALAEQIFG